MPITLGCPSCGKRFRARDESIGKRVKCPFCQAAVPVPSPEEAHNASAPTDVVEPMGGPGEGMEPPGMVGSTVRPGLPGAGERPLPVASAGAWGAGSQPTEPEQPRPPAPRTPARPAAPMTPSKLPDRAKLGKPAKPPQTPEQHLAACWAKVSSGLFWVLFGLFLVALMGFVPFGKLIYERSVGELPKGEGWVKIEGYVNTPGPDTIQLDKREEIDILAYGVPAILGGLALSMGRITAGAAPRNSGAKGLFAFSGLFTLLSLAGLVTWMVCDKLRLAEIGGYSRAAFWVFIVLAEFWFLLALSAAGATLKRPKAVRAVGFYALVLGLGYVMVTHGWTIYVNEVGKHVNRPASPDPSSDWFFYETAVKMVGFLLLIGVYWQAVAAVKRAAREFVRDVDDRTVPAA